MTMASRKPKGRKVGYILAGSMGFMLALALAFFVVAMPADIFEGLITASGLPSIVSAAAPPLGMTARMIVAGLVALIAHAAVIALFLLLDRESHPKQQERETDPVFFTPPQFEEASEPSAAPLPEPARLEILDVAFSPVPSPVTLQPADDSPIFLDFQALRGSRPIEAERVELGDWKIVEPGRAGSSSSAPKPLPQVEQVRPLPSTAITAPAPAQLGEDESIAALMRRLEAGLERRAQTGAQPAQAPKIDRGSQGLHSTLDELRKMAVRR